MDGLYQRAGESAKAASDLPRREAELTTRTGELKRLLARAGLALDTDCVDQFRISDADRARLAELASDRAAVDQARESGKQSVARLKRRISELDQRKPSAPTLTAAAHDALSEAVEAARAAGDLDTLATSSRQAADDHSDAAKRACEALPGWDGDVEALECLAIPAPATVKRLEREHVDMERAAERLEDRARALDGRAGELDTNDRSLAAGPHAPTRAEVADVRQNRDEEVSALIATPSGERAAVARSCIRAADELADARADHAELAAARDRLERDQAGLAKDRAELKRDQDAHGQLDVDFAKRWAAQWPGLPGDPLPPQEMQEWMAARSELLATAHTAREDDAGAKRAEQAIEQHRNALAEFLGEAATNSDRPRPLKQVLARASSLLSEDSVARAAGAEYERDRTRLVEDLSDAQAAVTQAETALAGWTEDWQPVVEALGLPTDATPAQAQAQLAVVDKLVATFDGVAEWEHRVERLREDEATFTSDARALASELAPELVGAEPLHISECLHARAASARSVRAARQQLEPQHRKLSLQATAAASKRSDATARLERFAQRAGVSVEDLDTLCETIKLRDDLNRELRGVENELAAAGAASITELTTEIGTATPESLAGARADDEAEAAELESRRSELERQAGALREKLTACGGDAAAVAAEQEAHARAAVIDGYERYTELALAAALLRAAIERHRKQNEGPLLRRASELFARLSAGTMSGLTVVTTEKDPYIMGVLPDQREVPVDGMSAGQRHQLFLALRLASLERHFEHNEPMPLILDDLLVQLDNVSARAALEIFVELSRTVQVLFFTHHDHLVAMARENVPPDLLVEHEICEIPRPALRAA